MSFKVAPPTRTRSVVKNRALAAAYAGAHRFGVEVFEPATSNMLMAALLVHDLRTGAPAQPTAVAGRGVRRRARRAVAAAYDPRSALGLAALLGRGLRPLSRRTPGRSQSGPKLALPPRRPDAVSHG